jgi:hypothetical protein
LISEKSTGLICREEEKMRRGEKEVEKYGDKMRTFLYCSKVAHYVYFNKNKCCVKKANNSLPLLSHMTASAAFTEM